MMPDALALPDQPEADIETHPAAAFLPMLVENDLAELAEDIKTNGLLEPIVLDSENRILDGRNRLAACRRAGVAPHYVHYEGSDPIGFVVSKNVKRRNLTKPQRAVAAARAWQQAQAEGLVQVGAGRPQQSAQSGRIIVDPRAHFGQLFGVSKNYVNMAKRVLDYSVELSEQVSAAAITLEEAYDRSMEAERHARQEQETLRRLREFAPDLVERIQRDNLSIPEAEAIFRERDREFSQQRQLLYRLLNDFSQLISPIATTRALVNLPELLDVDEFDAEFREVIKGGVPELQERLRHIPDAVKVLTQVLRDFDRRARRRA